MLLTYSCINSLHYFSSFGKIPSQTIRLLIIRNCFLLAEITLFVFVNSFSYCAGISFHHNKYLCFLKRNIIGTNIFIHFFFIFFIDGFFILFFFFRLLLFFFRGKLAIWRKRF